MALSEDKRNLIAYRFIVLKFSHIEVGKFFTELKKLCEEIGISEDDNERLTLSILQNLNRLTITELPIDEKKDLYEMAWKLSILYTYHKGVRLSDNTKREIGNEGSQLGLNTETAMAFAGLLSQEVHNMIFSGKMFL